jgi:hypothetical protein
MSEAIRKLDAKARIILLTTFDGEEDIYRGIRAGARSRGWWAQIWHSRQKEKGP